MKSLKKVLSMILMLSLLLLDPFGILCEKVQAKSQIIIVIDPGHGGPGTADEQELGAKYNGVFEKDLTLITATAMKNELEQYGNVTVYMTRTADQPMTLANRSAFAASVGADALISIHYNASAEHNFYGSEVFTSAFGQHYATGTGLGSCFLKQLCATGSADKGCKTRIGKSGTDYYGIIRHGVNNNVPTIIVEHGYIDNDTDWSRMNSASAWQQLGIGDATAVAQYYGLEKGVTKVDVAPTVNVAVPSNTMMPDLTPPTNMSVTIDETNASEHTITYTATASESESKLMYCTYSTDNGTTYAPLSLCGSGKSHTETITVPAGFSGNILFRAYNNYELDVVSNPVAVKLEEAKEDQSKDSQNEKVNADQAGSQADQDSSLSVSSTSVDSSTSSNLSDEETEAEKAALEQIENEKLWGDHLQDSLAENTTTTEPEEESSFPTWAIVAIAVGAVLLGVIITAICVAYAREQRRRRRRKKR